MKQHRIFNPSIPQLKKKILSNPILLPNKFHLFCVTLQHDHIVILLSQETHPCRRNTMVTLQQSPVFNFSSLSSPKPQLRFINKKYEWHPCTVLRRRTMKIKASSGRSHGEFQSLNSPLQPRTHVGKFLSGVLQNHRRLFHIVANEELKLLSDDRDYSFARMLLSQGSDEALLHRIAKLKDKECEIAVEDVMYMVILHRFSEIRAPLVPKISSCIYNGRLEIFPCKNWELESLHSPEVLDIVREYASVTTGLKINPSVNETWATTKARKSRLRSVYVASMLYGYLLKSVSLKYHLERSLSLSTHDDPYIGHGSKGVILEGLVRQEEKIEGLKCYVKSFHTLLLLRCGTLRSEEAVNLVYSHIEALFGKEKSALCQHGGDDDDDVILTSFSSLRRLVLEAVAFGSFLWEAEDYIESVYKLKYHEYIPK